MTRYAIPEIPKGETGTVFEVPDGRAGILISPECTLERATKLFATLFAIHSEKNGGIWENTRTKKKEEKR